MMIRGALILAVGYGLGHAKGLSENTLVLDKLESITKSLGEWVEKEIEHNKTFEKFADYEIEGTLTLLDRLKVTLPQVGDAPDDKPVLSDSEGNTVLTVGDLRGPFSGVDWKTNDESTDDQVIEAEVVEPDAGPEGETPS